MNTTLSFVWNKPVRVVSAFSGSIMLCIALAGCVSRSEREAPAATAPAPRLAKAIPPSAVVGVGFSVQPSGESALSVVGEGFQTGAKVRINGTPLVSSFGGTTGLTALVPAEFYAAPGKLSVTVQNPDGQLSNLVEFTVFPAKGGAPEITRTWPAWITAGKSFNVQPDGESAVGLEGTGFLPGSKVVMDGTELVTAFGGPSALTALVPKHLFEKPHRAQVVVRGPDGKSSKPFVITVQ